MKKAKKTILQKRIEKIRQLDEEELKNKINKKTLSSFLELKKGKGTRGGRTAGGSTANLVDMVMVGAGKRDFKGTQFGDMIKLASNRKLMEAKKVDRPRYSYLLSILESGGFGRRCIIRKGRRWEVEFKYFGSELPRLKKSVEVGKILFKEELEKEESK